MAIYRFALFLKKSNLLRFYILCPTMIHWYSPFILTGIERSKQMKLSLGVVNSTERILSSFNGSTTVTLGDVALPVKVGPMTQQVLFLIVEDLGLYNAIIGRAWQHSMITILSTYHHTVSYLIDVGQVDLLGSQLATRKCYQLSMQEPRGEKNVENPPLKIKLPCSNHNSSPRSRWKRRIPWSK